MKHYYILFLLTLACTPSTSNPILQLEEKIQTEIPYHFNYKTIPVDCTKRDSLFLWLYKEDQRVRTIGGDMLAVDERNFDLLISYIERCGWPKFEAKVDNLVTLKEDQIRSALFLVLQHSFREAMANYYFQFKESAYKYEMDRSDLALYQDRLLMYFDFPQLYGTQIIHDIDRMYLYQLWSPENVSERRKEVGLRPIEDYLEDYGLDYSQEIENQKARD